MIKLLKSFALKALYLLPSSAILMFHHITDSPTVQRSKCVLSFDSFKDIINHYSNYDFLEKVVEKPLSKKIVITFDDGLEDVYTLAYPFLKSKNIPFTIFIITDLLDTAGYVTTEQLKEMANDDLVTIGAHGVSHKVLNSCNWEEQKYELLESKKRLEKITGKPVNAFAFSHGGFNKKTIKLMKNYKYGFTVKERPLNAVTVINKKLLPRFNVENNTLSVTKQTLERLFKDK